MPTTTQYLNELISQKKALANSITAKGVAASESEKFNTLVPKVAQIEELKGEEKVLDNITQYNNTPQSIVSINYPENVSKKIDLQLSSKNLFDKSIPIKDVYVTADAIRKGYKIPVNAGTYTVSGGSNDTFCKTLIGDIYGAYHVLGISRTLTLETDGYILIYGLDVQFVTAVLDTLQMESGSTATAYTPYISDFSNVNVKACGKNLLENPNVHAYNYSADYKKYNSADEIFLPAGTYSISASKNMPTLQFWNKETKAYYTVDEVVSAYSTNTYYKLYDGRGLGRASDAVNRMYFTLKKEALITLNSGISTETTVQCQLELGSTVTSYEPYQGQTYTSTSDGKVSGISSIYPTTNIFTDNAGALITVYQGTPGNSFIEVLPSEGKNGITKIQQPIVDSSIDFNIKPENIKKGITILGITGTYEPTA